MDAPRPGRVVRDRVNNGLSALLATIDRLADEPDLRFHFAGRGDAHLERLVAEAAAVDGRITAEIGWVDPARKAALYRRAALVVLPYSQFASQSGVLHDAYAYRVPVVATDVAALGDTVREDGTGWVVPPDDPEALAAAISAALADGAAWSSARSATDCVARERSQANIGLALRSLYVRVLSSAEQIYGTDDIEVGLRLWLAGSLATFEPAAVVHYRNRTETRQLWRQGLLYGRCRPLVARRLVRRGGRDLGGSRSGNRGPTCSPSFRRPPSPRAGPCWRGPPVTGSDT